MLSENISERGREHMCAQCMCREMALQQQSPMKFSKVTRVPMGHRIGTGDPCSSVLPTPKVHLKGSIFRRRGECGSIQFPGLKLGRARGYELLKTQYVPYTVISTSQVFSLFNPNRHRHTKHFEVGIIIPISQMKMKKMESQILLILKYKALSQNQWFPNCLSWGKPPL